MLRSCLKIISCNRYAYHYARNSRSRIVKGSKRQFRSWSQTRKRREREHWTDPSALLSAFHERTKGDLSNWIKLINKVSIHIPYFLSRQKNTENSKQPWPDPARMWPMNSHAQLLTRSFLSATERDRARPLSHSSPLNVILAGRMPWSHFTVSAAIHHRVKVKVLWKQAEEGKITDKCFRSTALFKVIRKWKIGKFPL